MHAESRSKRRLASGEHRRASGAATARSKLGRSAFDSPLVWSAIGVGLLWAALPPLRWWPLAWPGFVCWAVLAMRPDWKSRRFYVTLWFTAALYWVAVMQGIRLAHWANYIGLLALAGYLGIYLPLFVALARAGIHHLRLSPLLVVPVTWTGVEVLRGYGPLGFSMALLGHTQVSLTQFVQLADLTGAYGVGFVMALVSVSLLSVRQSTSTRGRLLSSVPAVSTALVALAYGHYRLTEPLHVDPNGRPVRVALIQGSIDTVFEDNPDRPAEILAEYRQLTERASKEFAPLDLVVWPESMFPINEVLIDQLPSTEKDPTVPAPATLHDNQLAFEQLTRSIIRQMQAANRQVSDQRPVHWLLGTTTWQFTQQGTRRYNAALLLDERAAIVGRYYKMHPVIFGEYVPFGERFPWLYNLFPLPCGLTPGTQPLAFRAGSLNFSTSICFENVMPHLIRGHVAQLNQRRVTSNALVNLTNDGWFWGSSILDMQLDCARFRAIELRRPFLVAANTGLSASIDGNGRVHEQGPRRATGILLAEVTSDGRFSGYEVWGDIPAGTCTVLSLIIGLVACVGRCRRAQKGNRSRPKAVNGDWLG